MKPIMHGNITIATSVAGVKLLVDTRTATTREDWDRAVLTALRMGYQFPEEADYEHVGVWEVWDLEPI